jgi:hypothetical protein
VLLGQTAMQSVHASAGSTPPLFPSSSLSLDDREKVLRFAATFLWADLELADEERTFFTSLARELDVDDARAEALLSRPPTPEDIDPNQMTVATADIVRQVALRAIASDGEVHDLEMQMFELLDDLLPRAREIAE